MKSFVLFFLIAVGIQWSLYALSPNKENNQYVHEAWTEKDGLPVSTVRIIKQTSDGYLWLGTEEGVLRFDGIKFDLYNQANTPEISNNQISAMFEDSSQRLWIGTYKGLSFRKHQKFNKLPELNELSNIIVRSIIEDSSKTLWFGTSTGLYTYKDKLEKINLKAGGIPDEDIRFLQTDSDGAIWFISGKKHLCSYKNGKFSVSTTVAGNIAAFFIDSKKRFWLNTMNKMFFYDSSGLAEVKAVNGTLEAEAGLFYEDSDGNIWIGTFEKSLVKYSGNKYSFFENDDAGGFPVCSIFEDKEKNLWVGTAGSGLYRFNDSKITVFTKKHGLRNEMSLSLYEDNDGGLWVGTLGGGLHYLKNGHISSLDTDKTFGSDAVFFTMANDEKDDLWLGVNTAKKGKALTIYSKGRFVLPKDKRLRAIKRVVVIFRDSKNSIWITSDKETLFRYKDGKTEAFSNANGLSDNDIKAMTEDKEGNIWIGTDKSGVIVYDGKKFMNDFVKEPLVMNSIISLFSDSSGRVWIATNGNGINIYEKGKLFQLTVKEGLPDSMVFKVLEDMKGNFWMSSNKGIIRIEKSEVDNFLSGISKTVRVRIFGTSHGLLSAECVGGTQTSGYATRDGKLYFSTVRGLAVIDPDNIAEDSINPPAKIETVAVNNMPFDISEGKLPEFEKGLDKIEVEYTALSFRNAENLKFRHILDGFDKEWTSAGSSRIATYTNLAPGSYTFRVIAANSKNIWNETGDSFTFVIKPLFYQTPYFYPFMLFMIILMVFLIFFIRMKILARQNKKLVAMVEQKTDELIKANSELKEMSLIDPLTGLKNRRYFSEIIKEEAHIYLKNKGKHKEGKESRKSTSEKVWGIYLMDMDFFKEVNDRYGHDSGDLILKQIASILKDSVRANDTVIRWGGEEFLIILKNTDPLYLPVFSKKIRLAIAGHSFKLADGKVINKTCSLGFLQFPFHSNVPNLLTIEQNISIADLGLYYAKNNNRNKAIFMLPGDNFPQDDENDDLQRMLFDLEFSMKQEYFEIRVN